MPPIDLSKAPKQFSDNIVLGFNEEVVIMAVLSGANASVFAITPESAKRLSLHLASKVAEFEKATGKKVVAEWPQSPISPLHGTDLPGSAS